MWNSLTFGSCPAPALSSSLCWSSPSSTPSGGGSRSRVSNIKILLNFIMNCRETVHIKRLTSGRIVREGLREFKRTAFSTPSLSRKNSLETQSFRRKFSTEDLDLEDRKAKVSVSSLVGELFVYIKNFNIFCSSRTYLKFHLLWKLLLVPSMKTLKKNTAMFSQLVFRCGR